MKFLLVAVNAKYIHSNPGLYSLRAYAGEEYASHIKIAEYTINNRTEEILAAIYEEKPDVIAFSCYIWNWMMIRSLLSDLHQLLPDIPIWLGGPEVSFDAEDILRSYPMVSGIMVGEGEATFKELFQYYLSVRHSELREIPGLLLRQGDQILSTMPRELTDLSSLPFLYEEMAPFENRIIYYESSRGCPYRCSYCLSSIDKRLRLRDISVVKKELQYFLDLRVPQVKFVDRTFNCDHTHAMAIWSYLIEHDNGVTNFHFEIAADIIKEEELKLLKQMRPGLVQLEIGVQSCNQDTLREIRRTMDLKKLEYIVETIRRGGNIHQHLDLIAGLPYEDYESFGHSFDRVYRMQPNQLQLGFLKVLKGSYMHEKVDAYGIAYTKEPPYEVLYSKWLPYQDVLRLKRIEEMVKLYYNSNQFRNTLAMLSREFERPFVLFERLADYYEEKGYFTTSPARSYRYQVLFHFIVEQIPEKKELYQELLTFDLYLRENLKSRPDFAKDLSPYKDRSRSFYQKEEEERVYLPEYGEYDSKQLSKMTHLEPFTYDVYKIYTSLTGNVENLSGKETECGQYILFDYQKRDPLSGDAFIQIIREAK